ncbi:MAG: hypothetical protein JRG92_20580 [Deltaproteobacteria bacterium]|nr:hypothetical protein [Deltaproteobacteria bacterium]
MDEEATEQAEKGALLDLIEVERRVEADLASAAAEAEQIVESARAEAQSEAADDDAALESGLEKVRASMDRECETTLRSLEDRASVEEKHYRLVGDAELQELARWVAARVVGIGAQS